MSLRTILAMLWTTVLLVACLLPARWLSVNESHHHRFTFPHIDKIVHGTLFAGFGFLWMQAARSRREQVGVLAVGILLAVLTELGQSLPFIGRDADPLDGLADVVGVMLGLAAAFALSRCLEPQEVEPIEQGF